MHKKKQKTKTNKNQKKKKNKDANPKTQTIFPDQNSDSNLRFFTALPYTHRSG